MRVIFTIFFITFAINSHSQNNDFSIDFKHSNPSIVFSEVEIYIKKSETGVFVFARKGDSASNRHTISNEDFEKLKNKILSIKPSDVINVNRNCLDSGTTEITFAEVDFVPLNSVKYTVDCLSISDDKTSKKDFLNTVKLILELAKFNFEDLK
ncbi:hypothetical protein IP98_02904 [Flavobacterium cauense R2A-7]|uniref:Uncharacterized protein n=1 Tax=Flavobacterium cauense R2A-7 TaxID=1341154 RepID=A0A562LK93_9FLAO|nr:hypothetical protein [Flavobacterium cauense]KGO79190.1 hypothetical protein Q762_14555 [Flavobacterium cauense R2A-7]TWI08039.1 hypothetical protein IP98_02904 [Flavobacterium cauense R2A-7]